MKTSADSSHDGSPARPRIRLLRDDVINKIAAGEVIERPAAVVKELLENSLDAGATRIEIEFRHGGKSLIRIEDNGHGMRPDDAMLALERHATSKLRDPDDLLRITSMGFRGEALPSIASISRFTLQTRTAQNPEGCEILVNGGKIIHRRECGMAPGTRIEVAHLFNSVPARRKFLKSDNTEAAHIVHLVRLHAVARPEVDFTLIEDGRIVFRSPKGNDLRQRVAEIWGNHLAEPLEILTETNAKGLRLYGLIGRPGTGRTSRREMITLVNRRPVESRTLTYAIIEACHTSTPKGRYPLAFLFLEIDPATVDVNVHPAKREVRFRDEGIVRRFVIEAITQRINELTLPPTPTPANDRAAVVASAIIKSRQESRAPAPTPEPPPVSTDFPAPTSIPAPTPRPIPRPAPLPAGKPSQTVVPPTPVSTDAATPTNNSNWQLIGRLPDGLALFDTSAGLVVLNIRAAQVRISFEQLEDSFRQNECCQQTLLIPQPLEVDQLGAVTLEEHREFLEKHGFSIEAFGRNFYRLEAHPAWLPTDLAEEFVRELITALRDGKLDPARSEPARTMLARMATARTRRSNERLGDDELSQLVITLLRCRQPLVCPDGRPTFFEMPHREIRKRLGLG